MQITTAPVPARSSQAQAPRNDAPPAPPSDGFLPSRWQENTGIQVGIWGVASAASAVIGKLAGPQVGLLAGGAVGAAAGIATSAPESKWYDKAAAAVWGFGMNSTVGLLGDVSLAAGLATGALHAGVTGWAYAKVAKGEA